MKMRRSSATALVLCALLAAAGCSRKDDATEARAVTAPETSSTESADEDAADRSVADGEGEAPSDGVKAREERVERWILAEGTVDCVGVGPQQCLRVKRPGARDWTLLYSPIVGLDGAPGESVEAEIHISPVENPPADGASERYELVRIVAPAADPESASSGSESKPRGRRCTSARDCADDEMCVGPEGCEVPWTCQPRRPCTRDLRPYCSCDGETVRGSGSCPPEPYRYRGECRDDE